MSHVLYIFFIYFTYFQPLSENKAYIHTYTRTRFSTFCDRCKLLSTDRQTDKFGGFWKISLINVSFAPVIPVKCQVVLIDICCHQSMLGYFMQPTLPMKAVNSTCEISACLHSDVKRTIYQVVSTAFVLPSHLCFL